MEKDIDFVGKYVGGEKIAEAIRLVRHTPLGKEMIKLVYDSGKEATFSLEDLEAIISNEPLTPTQLSDRRIEPVVAEILAVLLEHDLTLDDAFRIQGAVMSRVNLSVEDAIRRAFGKLLDREIYFNTARGNITLGDLNDLLSGKLVAVRKEDGE